jgi:hypothetical protein
MINRLEELLAKEELSDPIFNQQFEKQKNYTHSAYF